MIASRSNALCATTKGRIARSKKLASFTYLLQAVESRVLSRRSFLYVELLIHRVFSRTDITFTSIPHIVTHSLGISGWKPLTKWNDPANHRHAMSIDDRIVVFCGYMTMVAVYVSISQKKILSVFIFNFSIANFQIRSQ